MSTSTNMLKGVIHGRTIDLAEEPGLPDGQEVTVIIQANVPKAMEGVFRSAGACADEADDLDAYLAWNRQQRKISRRAIDP